MDRAILDLARDEDAGVVPTRLGHRMGLVDTVEIAAELLEPDDDEDD